ncbi:MAG TPA: glycosyltransferase family 2 protein [Gemmatimonadales bacterium]
MSIVSLWPALPWLGPLAGIAYLARRTPDLTTAPVASGRLLSVIIPARNEAETIETVVRSVLQSAYAPLEVIVVDDRSTDDTALRTERLAREDERVRLVRGAELPPGWFGKPWACWQGYRAAGGDLLVFTDADTTHGRELLGHAVGALEAERADLLTLMSRQRCETLWERLVMPQIWVLLGFRYKPARVNSSTRPRDVIANGQFIMLPRVAYEAIGTHAAVRSAVAEDLALAQTLVRSGRKLRFVHAEPLISTRMYRSLGHLIEGWSKNIYLGGRASFPDEPVRRALVPLILSAAMLFWLIPPLVGLAALAGLVAAAPWVPAAIALSALFWMLVSFGMQIPPLYGLGYPLGAAAGLYIVLRSVGRGARKVEWKGRVYDVRTGMP